MDKAEPRFSRRALLLAGGGAAAVAALAAPFRKTIARRSRSLVGAQTWLRPQVSLAHASYEDWQALAGSVFVLGGGSLLTLAGVQALQSGGARPPGLARDKAFLAVFDPLAGATLPGDLIYTAGTGEYAPLQIFLSASSDRATPGRMLAVFN